MKEIPKAARAAVAVIGQMVKRPKHLPKVPRQGQGLRWRRGRKLWEGIWGPQGKSFRCCPLGLIPGATHPTPTNSYELGQSAEGFLTSSQVRSFLGWWDRIGEDDAQEAVDAVWGKE